MERLDTGFRDDDGVAIHTGDVIEQVGLSGIPRRFVVFLADFADEDTKWRLDESGDRTALVYPWLDSKRRRSVKRCKVLGRYSNSPELLTA